MRYLRPWIMPVFTLVLATGVTGFNDLSVTEQRRVFEHCNKQERIEKIVDVCYEDLFPAKCWMPHFRVCLDTWR